MADWVSLADLVAPVVAGTRLAIGGMTLYRRPVAAAVAIARSQVDRLEVMTLTAGLETDLLIGAGCVSRLRSCYVGLEIAGLAPHFTQAARAGAIEVVEETEYTLSHGVLAAAMRLPFMPMLDTLGATDLYRARPDLVRFTCPVTHRSLVAVPALTMDVALIHAAAADDEGNCWLPGQLALDSYLPTISRTTLVTAERRVSRDELLGCQGGLRIPAHSIDRLALVPGGAAPTSCHPYSGVDMTAVLDYLDAAEDPARWSAWLAGADLRGPHHTSSP